MQENLKQWLLRDVTLINDKGSAMVLTINENGQVAAEPLVSTGKFFFATDKAELEFLIELIEKNIKEQREIFKESTEKNVIEKYLSFEKKLLEQLKAQLEPIE